MASDAENRWKDAAIIIVTVVMFTLLFANRDAEQED